MQTNTAAGFGYSYKNSVMDSKSVIKIEPMTQPNVKTLHLTLGAAMKSLENFVVEEHPSEGNKYPKMAHWERSQQFSKVRQLEIPEKGSDNEVKVDESVNLESILMHAEDNEPLISEFEAIMEFPFNYPMLDLKQEHTEEGVDRGLPSPEFSELPSSSLSILQKTMVSEAVKKRAETDDDKLNGKKDQRNKDDSRLFSRICDKKCKNNLELSKHTKFHASENSYKCNTCGRSFKNQMFLERHLQSRSCKKIWSCDVCDKILRTKESMTRHRDTHFENKLFTCKICAKTYTRDTGLIYHMKEHLSKQSFPCKICGKIFLHQSPLKRHMRTHCQEKLFWCAECGKGFCNKGNMKSHARSHMRDFACNLCDQKFNYKHHLDIHLMKHTGEKPFTCADCSKSFTTKHSMVMHAGIHLEKCFRQIKVRPKKSSHGSNGSKSLRKGNSYDCKICDRKCSAESILRIHMVVHENDKVSCKICSMSFRNKDLLVKHEKLHENQDRPFICDHCGCKYIDKSNLRFHIMKHTGERPIECQICGKRWKDRGGLRKHMKSHTDERPFRCEVCQSSFKERYKLTRHVRARHPEKLSD